jgi:puromycin-sensitive aminopeptidase
MIPDALHNSHPIEMPIRRPTEIDEIFDDITYEKGIRNILKEFLYPKIFLGSSVIRLLHAYIGDEPFRRGLSNYLKEYAYKNTITDNLWSHLSIASNRSSLSDILSTWTKQMGYPLLTVCLFVLKYIFVDI